MTDRKEYIERGALLKCIDDEYDLQYCEIEIDPRKFYEMVEATPTADVTKVVFCAQCKYYQDNNGGYPHKDCRWGHEETPNPDDYCSYGERKDGAGND